MLIVKEANVHMYIMCIYVYICVYIHIYTCNTYMHNMHRECSVIAQSCLTLCYPMDCSLPGFSIHGIFQARIPEWVAISFSRRSSQPRDPTRVSPFAADALPSEPPGNISNHACLYVNVYTYLSVYLMSIINLYRERQRGTD